ncbi:MAG: SUF system NifU family Fe-S cluster assembly protein [Verrucomicrobiota bacterium JB022]|nr:SUF system NifU family Fe-S cluster assembly protein [Verrucomicrobiota bacterium JB022]
MYELEELYQEIILEHNKRPRNFRVLDDHTAHAEGNNPMCGDEIEVFLKTEGDHIAALTFQGEGCAISKASASLMTEALTGRSVQEAYAEIDRVMQLLKEKGIEPDLARDGDIAALTGVRKFPARIKCATLAWHALRAALEGQGATSTEE